MKQYRVVLRLIFVYMTLCSFLTSTPLDYQETQAENEAVLTLDSSEQDEKQAARMHYCKTVRNLVVCNSLSAGNLSVGCNAIINGDLTVLGFINGRANINLNTKNHAVQVGNAQGGLTSIPVGENGQVLLGSTNADPVFAYLTSSDGSITYTTGPGSLDLKATLQLNTTNHAVQVGNAMGTLTSIPVGTNGQVLLGSTGADPVFANLTSADGSITFTTGPGSLDLESVMQFGNVVRVDSVFGNDATGQRNGAPFLTINAALAVAQSGDAVWIFPGTYAESFTIPNGVNVLGLTTGGVDIIKNVNVATDLVTMGENTRLENVNLQLTSSSHVQLRGIVFPGTTTATSKVRTAVLTVDNSGAGAGSSDVYGIHSNGTATPGEEISAIRATTINVFSTGLGTKRGILVDTANDFHIRDTNVRITNSGGGSSIGVETNHVSAQFAARTSTINGSNSSNPTAGADISQTLGTITIVTTDLLNSNANGLGFGTEISPSTLVWADPGALPSAIRFMRPGTAPVTAAENAFIRAPQSLIVKSLTARARMAPGGANVATVTLRKNSVDTPLTVTLTDTQLSNTNNAITVSFAAGDSISIKTETTGGSTADIVVSAELY